MAFKEMQQLFPMAQRKIKLSRCSVQCTMTNSCGENKPEIIQYYNSTKGEEDTIDQMVRYYSIKQMTPIWPMVVLFNKKDISVLIAIIIWMELQTYLQYQKGVRRVCLSD